MQVLVTEVGMTTSAADWAQQKSGVRSGLLVLVLVDGLCSQSAVYAHITAVSIQSVLKSID